MSQINFALAQVVTLEPNYSVSGAVAASGLIKITTSAVNALVTGDVVQISGVTGTVEANGKWVITVVDTSHFTLNNSTFLNAYSSGGTIVHVGFVTPAVLMDNTVFPSTPVALTMQARVESLSSGANVRMEFQDSADVNFVTGGTGPTWCKSGLIAFSYDDMNTSKLQDFPDMRYGSSGDNWRFRVEMPTASPGASVQFSAWVRY